MYLFKTSQDIIICSQYSFSFTHALIIFVALQSFLLLPPSIRHYYSLCMENTFSDFNECWYSLVFDGLKMTYFILIPEGYFSLNSRLEFFSFRHYSSLLSSGSLVSFETLAPFNCCFFESNLSPPSPFLAIFKIFPVSLVFSKFCWDELSSGFIFLFLFFTAQNS